MAQSDEDGVIHGGRDLPRVIVDGYGEDVRTKEGYFGELASNGAFKKLVKDLRERAEPKAGGDPIENEPAEITRGRIDKLLKEGDSAARRRHPQRRREVRAKHRPGRQVAVQAEELERGRAHRRSAAVFATAASANW